MSKSTLNYKFKKIYIKGLGLLLRVNVTLSIL